MADFAVLYVREAHASDEWAFDWWKYSSIAAHRSLADRLAAARLLLPELEKRGASKSMAFYVDSMADVACNTYGAAPERLAILHEGKLAWLGGPGPWAYDVGATRTALKALVAA